MIWKFLKQNILFPKGLNWVGVKLAYSSTKGERIINVLLLLLLLLHYYLHCLLNVGFLRKFYIQTINACIQAIADDYC